MLRSSVAFALTVLVVLLGPSPSRAGIIRVPTDFVNVTNAVAAAAPGDTLRLAGNGGSTYPVSNLTIEKDLRIEGGWRIDFQVRDPRIYISVLRDTTSALDRERPVVRVVGSPSVEFDGLEILDGRFGVLAEEGATLSFRDVRLAGHRNTVGMRDPARNGGTAIRMVGGVLDARNVLVENAITGYAAGGIGIHSAVATLTDVRFFNVRSFTTNPAINGGAILAADSDLTARNVVVETCATVQGGGALHAERSTVDLEGCRFEDNLGSARAGAVSLKDCPEVRITDCVMSLNRAGNAGALLSVGTESLEIRGTRFDSNRPGSLGDGGAMILEDTQFLVADCEFEHNWQDAISELVAVHGGAVYSLRSNGQVTGTSFRDESVANAGGAWSQVGGDVVLSDSRFENCSAYLFGGAVSIEQGGIVRLERCLLAGNSAQFGGAVSASFTASLGMDHCTLVDQSASSAGANVYVDTAAEVSVSNSVLCCAQRGDLVYCGSGSIFFDHNDVWNDDASNPRAEYAGSCPNLTGVDGNLSVAPQFCPGDPDYAIQDGSPLQGAGVGGTDLGWRPAGCPGQVLSVRETSWGRIKAGFRTP